LNVREVELEHLKTTIIAYHEEYKVVEDLQKDVKNFRDKELNHREGGVDLQNYIDKQLKKKQRESLDT
jgi:hypothetical protein